MMPVKSFHATKIAEPNEFELRHRPSAIKHLPPLSAAQPAFSDTPKIVEHGSFTRSVPVKEKKFVRCVSDSIGNNYSPNARNFTTSQIYESTKLAYSVEEIYFLTPRKSTGSISPPNTHRGLPPDKKRRYSSGSSILVDALSYKVVSEYGDAVPASNRSQTPSLILPPINGLTTSTDKLSNGHEVDEGSRIQEEDETLASWVEKDGVESSYLRSELGSNSESALPLTQSLNGFSHEMENLSEHEISETAVYNSEKDNQNESGYEEGCRVSPFHDKETLECLEIEFPPWYFSTHGLSRAATPEPEDKERYYQLAEKAIDPSMVGPITKETLEGIYHFVPRKLRLDFPQTTRSFLKEVDNDYKASVRRAILDYVLLDPAEQERLGLPMPHKPSHLAGRDGFPWHESVDRSRNFLRKNLFITHPVMRRILYEFHQRYKTLRLVDIPGLRAIMPVTMETFLKHVQDSSKAAAAVLENVWLNECCELIDQLRDEVEAWMPADKEARIQMMDHFFNCVASLMSGLLRKCVETSLQDLVDLVECYHDGNLYEGDYSIMDGLGLSYVIHPVTIFLEEELENSSLQFTPNFPDVCDFFSLIIDTMVLSVRHLTRLEHKLFQGVEELEPKMILSVEIGEEVVENAKDKIRTIVLANGHGPKKYRSVYEPYKYLFTKETESKVQKFISREHPLKEYVQAIERLKKMAWEVGSLPVYVPMHFFLLDCTNVNKWLVETARKHIDTMVKKITDMSSKFNRQICSQYDVIVKKSSYQAENTHELVQLQDYVENLKVGELLQLKNKLEIAVDNMMFLMEYAYLPKEDITVNNTTFTWPGRIGPIVRNAENKLQREHDLACNKLKEKKKQFESLLEEYVKKVKDFGTKDRMSEADKYVAELEDISQKLELFKEEKLKINVEEQMLALDTQTEYHQIEDIAARKEPYEKLWSTAVTFHQVHDKWMNGPLLEVNAEDVEEGVQNLWRTAYKLTKVFAHSEFKGPMRASATIKAKLEKFKINMPLITALCNPGIKQRHWNLMSEKVGFNVTPKPDTPLIVLKIFFVGFNVTPKPDTPLQEILQLGLEKYLDDLTGISSQASKEYALEKALKRMKDDWGGMQFQFVTYKDSGVSILASFDDIQVLLEDHIVKTMTMKGSPFIKPFEDEINKWDNLLHRMKSILDSWLRVQSAWLYLEPIFGSQDIRNQIPVEGKMFEEVDAHWLV
ncbi:dynein axonemal heavy chain 3-like [Physella acuta]|uniref:dynein axonemal heavy chain 3-like n=1 Tax=Physella acuta TaxID=109671 RepID=UPI0027DCC1C7|nr:dynein axonemal heavy chain 3-like [Physella acuta]